MCHAVAEARRGGLAQQGGAAPAQEWTIELRGGAYPSLTEEDVSCFGAGVPLTLAPHWGEAVLMTGGKQIPSSAFKPAASGKANHLTVSLPSVGLPLGSYGVLVRAPSAPASPHWLTLTRHRIRAAPTARRARRATRASRCSSTASRSCSRAGPTSTPAPATGSGAPSKPP